MREAEWKKWASVTVVTAGVTVGLYLLCRFAVGLLLPFLVAIGLAYLLAPVSRRVAELSGLPVRAVAAVLTGGVLLAGGLLVYWACSRLLSELQNFLAGLSGNGQRVVDVGALSAGVIGFLSRFVNVAWLEVWLGPLDEFLTRQVTEWVGELSSRIPALLAEAARRLPGILLSLLVTLIACFYFALEYERVSAALLRLLPPDVRARAPRFLAALRCGLGRYLRAYCVLLLLTFTELLIGLFLLRVPYAFLLATLTAVLDLLPVLGVGTVLLPWAAFLLIGGRYFTGVGLLILYAVITVIRQVAEPHLVGKSLGLHPILMLLSFYVGLRLFGVVGVLLGPVVAMLIKAVIEKSLQANEA